MSSGNIRDLLPISKILDTHRNNFSIRFIFAKSVKTDCNIFTMRYNELVRIFKVIKKRR